MAETSPKVPHESQTLRIPLFSNNASLLGISISSRSTSDSTPSATSSYGLDRFIFRRCQTESTIFVKCKCPHVMVADDDPFQAYYYQTLFHKSMSFDTIPVKREDFRLEIFSSGEELIEAYRRYQACGCDSVMLIITDYNMGAKKLDGVETIQELVRAKYKGPLLLRTSDTLEELSKVHRELPGLLATKTLTQFIGKNEPEKMRETVQRILAKI